MKSVILLFLIGLFLSVDLIAQEQQNTSCFEAEIDPIAFALQGYSFHGIYVNNHFRADFGVFGIAQPESFTGNEGFVVKTQGVGLKLNYLLNESGTWFSGIGIGYSSNNIKLKETNQVQDQNILGIGLHLGYRWFMFKNYDNALKGLYLAPWFSIDYNNSLNDVRFENKNYTQKQFSIFPTVHIGYRF